MSPILQLGGLPEILAAMQSGAIHGGALSSPALTKAKHLGFKELMDLGNLGIQYPGLSYMTTEAYIKAQRPVVINFLKAIIESTHSLKRNKDFTIRVLKNIPRWTSPPCSTRPTNCSPSVISDWCRRPRVKK